MRYEFGDIIKNKNQFKDNYLRINYPDFYIEFTEYCEKYNLTELDLRVKLYMFFNFQKEIPKCKECNNLVKFNNRYIDGWKEFCSIDCMRNSDIIKERKKNTSIINFGVEYSFQAKDVKDKILNTLKNKYGEDIENPGQVKEIKEKIKITNLKNRGVDNPLKDKNVRLLCSNTMLEKYGNVNYSNSNIKKEEIRLNREKILKELNVDLNIDLNGIIHGKCINCKNTYEINYEYGLNRLKKDLDLCIKCKPISKSSIEEELINFIKDNYSGEILLRNRKLLKTLELDIYLSELNLAIEINGLYWHSDLFKSKDYHFKKFKACLDKGIKLITIWEDDWQNEIKNKIIRSRLINLCKKSFTKIYARNCIIQKIDNQKIIREFLSKNHLQGYVYLQYTYGLFYKDELVSIIGLGPKRKSLGFNSDNNDSFELIRFTSKLNTNVIGAGNKLLKHFLNNHKVSQIISYQNLDFGKGNFYEKLGFEFISYTKPSYFWIVKGKKENRWKYRKNTLVESGENKDLSENEIMKSKGFYKVYNSGNAKWIFKI